jgi:pimeloyl-ACP methyl ester carboxylesterase
MAESVPLILLSGLATDERLFAAQRARFPNLIVPKWIDPLPRESLAGYAARLARIVDPHCPCIVGGASFGGAVALEMATHLSAEACVLIGSVRSPAELPWGWRVLGPLLGPRRLRVAAQCVSATSGWCLPRTAQRGLARLANPRADFIRWGICAILNWRPSAACERVRVFQIHGAADRTLPPPKRADVVVPNGQHALTLFNATAVNEFLSRVCSQESHLGAQL